MDSERISRDFWRHSDSTGTHIRRTVGRALRDARAIAAGGGPDLSRAKRPEPRVSRLSSSCSRAIREVPSLPRRATVFGPCPRQQHLLPNVDRSQTRVSLARRASDPSRVLCDARAFPRVTLSASMSHGDTGAATGDEVRPPPTACRARIFFFFFFMPPGWESDLTGDRVSCTHLFFFFFMPPGWESDLTGIRATRASPPFPHLPSTSPLPAHLPPPPHPFAQSAFDDRVSEDRPSTRGPAIRGRNNSYTSSHSFVGITRRAPGDVRSNGMRPWRAQVNHAGKAYRAPGNFETPRQAAEAYDALVRSLGLQHRRAVNFPAERGETAFDRAGGRGSRGGRGRRSGDAARGRGRGRGRRGEDDAVEGEGDGRGSGSGRGSGLGRGGGSGRGGGLDRAASESALLESRLAALKASREKGLIDDDELAAGKAKVLAHFATGDLHAMEPA